MNRIIKIGFLIVMLGIPVAIFIFLKLFGNNRFDVDIYYQNGVETALNDSCSFPNGQFYVPNNLLNNPQKMINVVGFSIGKPSTEFYNIQNRLTSIYEKKVSVVLITEGWQDENIYTKGVDHLKQTMNCSFVENDSSKLVMVDNESRIRGYYSMNLDDIDRLIVEINILLENRDEGE